MKTGFKCQARCYIELTNSVSKKVNERDRPRQINS